jgi:hypothetical protein
MDPGFASILTCREDALEKPLMASALQEPMLVQAVWEHHMDMLLALALEGAQTRRL